MDAPRPDRTDALLREHILMKERAIRKLHDRGLSADEIADVLGMQPGQIPYYLAYREAEEERAAAWKAVLDRYFGRISTPQMTKRLLAVTYHTYERPAGAWYDTPPVSGADVFTLFLMFGYLSDKEYEEVTTKVSRATLSEPAGLPTT